MEPAFEIEEAGTRDGYRYYYDTDHVLCKVPSDGHTTMPYHIEYPLKARNDWEKTFKPRLNSDSSGRYAKDLLRKIHESLSKDYYIDAYIGSLFGILRNWVGFENICYMVHDDPGLLNEMIGHLADTICEILERALPGTEGLVCLAYFWEDITFNTGPMISPTFFDEYVVPRYKQITDVLHTYNICHVVVDSDGWIGPLIDSWMKAGVDIMFPLERASGSDPVLLRQQYGDELLLMGGVDKMKIASGGDDLVRELEYLAPLVQSGGYIPHCDHLCPADVSLVNYRFYLEKKREIFGIPQREERIRRYPADC
ncbi:MAG: hypothetical protein HN368_18855 [Spirochaetales bacterium]|nr:hypothetical protein [Spirochaetales bacterium]